MLPRSKAVWPRWAAIDPTVSRLGGGPAQSAPGAHDTDQRRLALALSLSLLFHALLLWVEPVRAPWGSAATRGTVINARLVAVRAGEAEAAPALPPAPGGVAVAAADAPPAEPLVPEKQAVPLPDGPAAAPARTPSEPASPEAAPAAEATAAPPPGESPGAFQVPLPGQPEFLPARMLDMLPRPEQPVELVYPDAVGMGRSGQVALLLLIDEFGVVVEAKVLESDPPGVFDAFAVEVFRSTRFLPGQRHGQPVRSRLVVEMSFNAGADSRRAP